MAQSKEGCTDATTWDQAQREDRRARAGQQGLNVLLLEIGPKWDRNNAFSHGTSVAL
jgi:hypothetical protein